MQRLGCRINLNFLLIQCFCYQHTLSVKAVASTNSTKQQLRNPRIPKYVGYIRIWYTFKMNPVQRMIYQAPKKIGRKAEIQIYDHQWVYFIMNDMTCLQILHVITQITLLYPVYIKSFLIYVCINQNLAPNKG